MGHHILTENRGLYILAAFAVILFLAAFFEARPQSSTKISRKCGGVAPPIATAQVAVTGGAININSCQFAGAGPAINIDAKNNKTLIGDVTGTYHGTLFTVWDNKTFAGPTGIPLIKAYAPLGIIQIGGSTATQIAINDLDNTLTLGGAATFTGSVDFGSGTLTGSGLTGNPNLAFKATAYTFKNGAGTSTWNLNLTPHTTTGLFSIGIDTNGGAFSSLTQSTSTARTAANVIQLDSRGGTTTIGDIGAEANGITLTVNDAANEITATNAIFVSTQGFTANGGTSIDGTGTIIAGHGINLDRTITAIGTTGNQTINKAAGTINVAAGAATVTLTNSFITANSIPIPVVRTADATCTFIKSFVPGAGSAVIAMNANCTAATSIGWIITN